MTTQSHGAFDFTALERLLEAATPPDALYQAIVNSPFHFKKEAAFLFLGIVVLLLADELNGTIDRIALSDTVQADATRQVSAKRFEDIHIPLNDEKNLIAGVVRTGEPGSTSDWALLFVPELTAQQARINQANGGIGYSAVYPVRGKTKHGALIFSYFEYPENIAAAQHEFMERYSQLVSRYLT